MWLCNHIKKRIIKEGISKAGKLNCFEISFNCLTKSIKTELLDKIIKNSRMIRKLN